MTLKIYSYNSCGTCRKALKWLDFNKLNFELIDILRNPPSRDQLISASIFLGDRKYLLNTSGLSYRSIGAKAIKEMSDENLFDALANDPKLIKRPFVVLNETVFLVGFKEEDWMNFLLG